MRKSTLFSHFAIWNGRPEDWATDALQLILNRNPRAPTELNRQLLQLVDPISPVIKRFEVRVGGSDGNGIPDLLGFLKGEVRLIIENKFFAALTPHQPTSYLRRLPDGGILLFIVPTQRLSELWTELRRRVVADTSMSLCSQSSRVSAAVRHQKICDGASIKFLALTTWQSVIEILLDACRDQSDVFQLKGLCDDMENIRALEPFCEDEIHCALTPRSLSKLLLLRTLLKDAIQQTTAATSLELPVREFSAAATATSNFNVIGDDYYFGFGVGVRSNGESIAWVGIHLGLWEKYETSPFWLGVHRDHVTDDLIAARLEEAAAEQRKKYLLPAPCFVSEQMHGFDDQHHYVALAVQKGQSQQIVLDDMTKQVATIIRAIMS